MVTQNNTKGIVIFYPIKTIDTEKTKSKKDWEENFMWLGKVVGTVVAPTKNESLIGNKLLVVQPLNLDGMNTISLQVAVDTVGAGNSDTVLVSTGSSARRVMNNDNSAVDAAIVGIVENIDLEGISKAQYWVQKG